MAPARARAIPRDVESAPLVPSSSAPSSRVRAPALVSLAVFVLALVVALLAVPDALPSPDAPAHARGDFTFALQRWVHRFGGAPAALADAMTSGDPRPRMSLGDVDVARAIASGRMLSEREFDGDAQMGSGDGCTVRFKDPEMRICHCSPDNEGPNAGDQAGPVVTRGVVSYYFGGCDASGIPRESTTCFGAEAHPCLITVGSVLEKAKEGDHVWGTGAWHEHTMMDTWKHAGAIIHGVRGLNTASELSHYYKNSDGSGSLHPAAIGDPGFLISFTHPELGKSERHGRCLVLHHYDDTLAPEGVRQISAVQNWDEFVRAITTCERVFTSSLHGLIFAEAFGIPARWYQNPTSQVASAEGTWKYQDWIDVSRPGQPQWREPAPDVRQIFDDNAYPPIFSMDERRTIARRMVARFPYHLFEVTSGSLM